MFANQRQQIYGSKQFQNKYTDIFTLLQSKYTQGTTFLAAKVEQEKESYFIKNTFTRAVGVSFSQQMPASKGFKVFGERALTAMIKELKQLNDGVVLGKPVVIPIEAD